MAVLGYSDIIFLIVEFFIVLVFALAASTTFDAVYPKIVTTPSNITNTLNASYNNTMNFYDMGFGALFFLFSIIALALVLLLPSHPVFLLMWLFINIVLFFLYDTLDTVVTGIKGTSLDNGRMNNAMSFFNHDMPKALMIFNALIAIVLYGRSRG